MNVIIQPSELSGKITAPASKSCMQRACALALIHKGKTIIHNPGFSADDLTALNIIQNLGTDIKRLADRMEIESQFPDIHEKIKINCGESGLSLRMFTPIAVLSEAEIEISGSGTLLKRPLAPLLEILHKCGIHASGKSLPIQVKGRLQTKNITVDGSSGSQYLTGLLLAFSYAVKQPATIKVQNLTSKPYIDLTLDMMHHFGRKATHKNYEEFTVYPAEHSSETIEYFTEGDWSNAAFLLVAGAIAGNITVEGISAGSFQADKKIINALRDCGAKVRQETNAVSVSKNNLKAFEFDATDSPDLFPPLVALAACCDGVSLIKGVHRLRHKESDRAFSLMTEFAKMNTRIEVENDVMQIYGSSEIQGAHMHSHDDHRIAMACAIAALRAKGNSTISSAEAVNKSYPHFFEDLKKLHVSVLSA